MAVVVSKQQMTALFSSTIAPAHELTNRMDKKLINLMENLCCAREHSFQFLMRFFCAVKLYILTKNICGHLDLMMPKMCSEYYIFLQFTYVSFSILSYACCSLDISLQYPVMK